MSELLSNIATLAALWRNDDHERNCGARYNSGPCTCGYDARLDAAITAVVNVLEEEPLRKEDADKLMVAIANCSEPLVRDGNALYGKLKSEDVDPA